MTVTTTDLDEIRAAGVNERDPDRCVARFASTARSVIANGARAIGREAIREAHAQAFARPGGPPGDARFVVLDAHLPRPDLAIVTTGAYRAAPGDDVDLGDPPTVVTWTLAREPDGWWVLARQFTPVA